LFRSIQRVSEFQVLTGDASLFTWEPSSQGVFVANALTTGKIGYEDILVGRAPFRNSLTVGKIQASQRCLKIPYDGQEHSIDHYEVLVYKKKVPMASLIDFGQSSQVRNRAANRQPTINKMPSLPSYDFSAHNLPQQSASKCKKHFVLESSEIQIFIRS
jgi:hypothetical protein